MKSFVMAQQLKIPWIIYKIALCSGQTNNSVNICTHSSTGMIRSSAFFEKSAAFIIYPRKNKDRAGILH
jgi:hypothetical protein